MGNTVRYAPRHRPCGMAPAFAPATPVVRRTTAAGCDAPQRLGSKHAPAPSPFGGRASRRKRWARDAAIDSWARRWPSPAFPGHSSPARLGAPGNGDLGKPNLGGDYPPWFRINFRFMDTAHDSSYQSSRHTSDAAAPRNPKRAWSPYPLPRGLLEESDQILDQSLATVVVKLETSFRTAEGAPCSFTELKSQLELRILKHWGRFDWNDSKLTDEFWKVFRTAARHLQFDCFRKMKRWKDGADPHDSLASLPAVDDEDPVRIALDAEDWKILQECLAKLGETERVILKGRLEGNDYPEIADRPEIRAAFEEMRRRDRDKLRERAMKSGEIQSEARIDEQLSQDWTWGKTRQRLYNICHSAEKKTTACVQSRIQP
jgi:hypothetical protein